MKDIIQKRSNVIVGMSGGLDSSVAAALLKEQGCRVTGVIMKIWPGGSLTGKGKNGCYGPEEQENIENARKIAAKLDIPFHVIDLTKEFQAEILDYFCHEYLSGRTPNPCIRCNRTIKFGALVSRTASLGIDYDYFATGHYACIEYNEGRGRYLLKKGHDNKKDQSYFLYALSQEQLGRTFFPLGGMFKDEVSEISVRLGLGVESKGESQNFVCGGYRSLFKTSTLPGEIVDKQGNVLGKHNGIEHFTIGQRKGLRLAFKEPLYVTSIDAEKSRVMVGPKDELYTGWQIVGTLNWIAIEELTGPLEATARIRNAHKGYEAIISPEGEGRVKVSYKEPQIGAAPGQAIVFYDKDTVIGGGIA
ncbi:MAG: tRNA 2-thiouridine(34) synthase MnmA [Dehalococcoidia bacterium]|nr:tRNA 2-thiouridine(34) synthase MnmA [Dehalococcoidia bacterium]